MNKDKNFLEHSGTLFLIGVLFLILLLLIQADHKTQETIRQWIQATGSALITIAVAYLGRQQAQIRAQKEDQNQKVLLEQQENNYYRTYLDQILRFLSQYNFSTAVELSIEFQIAKSLTSTALKEFNLERKNQIISFFQDLNAKGELPSPIPIFQKMQLNEADFIGLKAVGIDFSGSDLWYANFSEATLVYSKFIEAKLYGANFSKAKLKGVNFSKAKLEKAVFSNDNTHNLQKADFSESYLLNVNLSQIGFCEAKFIRANMLRINLSDSNLMNADLTEAKLIGANLKGADLTNTNFTNADLTGTDLTGAIFSNTVFKGAKTEGAKGIPATKD